MWNKRECARRAGHQLPEVPCSAFRSGGKRHLIPNPELPDEPHESNPEAHAGTNQAQHLGTAQCGDARLIQAENSANTPSSATNRPTSLLCFMSSTSGALHSRISHDRHSHPSRGGKCQQRAFYVNLTAGLNCRLVRDPGLTGVGILMRRIVRNRLKVIFVNFDCLTVPELDSGKITPGGNASCANPLTSRIEKTEATSSGRGPLCGPLPGDRNPRLHRGFQANRIVVIKS